MLNTYKIYNQAFSKNLLLKPILCQIFQKINLVKKGDHFKSRLNKQN